MCQHRTHHRTCLPGTRATTHFAKRDARFFGAGNRREAYETLLVKQGLCKKIGYADKYEAKLALRSAVAARRHEDSPTHERTIYKCQRCGLYHLTSWPALWTAHKGPDGIAVNAQAAVSE